MRNETTLDAEAQTPEEGDMPRPDRGYKQIALRVPAPFLKEADECAKLLSRPDIGYAATKADAFRVAIERGFAAIRADAKAQKTKK
jgi:hypothetical protein